jgi:hypothetical protein
MRRHGWAAARVAGVVVAMALGTAAAPALAKTKDCGKAGKAEELKANGVTCNEAKKLARAWLDGCNTDGLCVDESTLDERFSCNGNKKDDVIKVHCKGEDTGAKVRFEAPP